MEVALNRAHSHTQILVMGGYFIRSGHTKLILPLVLCGCELSYANFEERAHV
jgi:hypothetical protein